MSERQLPSHPRVLMVSPAGDGCGGISAVVALYAQYGILEALGIRVINTFENRGWRKLPVLLTALLQFGWVLLWEPVELVHINTSANTSFFRKCLFWGIARMFGRPVFWHVHSGEFLLFVHRRPWVLSVLRRSAGVAVLYSAMRDELDSLLGQGGATVTVLHNPFRHPPVVPLEKQSSPLSRAVYLGRISDKKGLGELLAAWQQLVREEGGIHLVIAGDGERARYEALAETLGLTGHVVFPGWVSGEAKEQLLRESQLLLLPSHFEAMPVSVLEAIGWGCVVVATPVGAILDMLDGGACGVLHPVRDVTGIVNAVKQLLPEEVRGRCTRAALKHLEAHYSPEAVKRELEAWYRSGQSEMPLGRI